MGNSDDFQFRYILDMQPPSDAIKKLYDDICKILQNHQEKNTVGGVDSEKKLNQVGVVIPGGEKVEER
jgi:hypothetical protein